jgi:hypothetical protein
MKDDDDSLSSPPPRPVECAKSHVTIAIGLGSIFPVSTGQAAGDNDRSGYALLRVFDRTVMGGSTTTGVNDRGNLTSVKTWLGS